MNEGGAGEYMATHVKLISLPLLMNISELPRIFAFDTANGKEKYCVLLFVLRKNTRTHIVYLTMWDEQQIHSRTIRKFPESATLTR